MGPNLVGSAGQQPGLRIAASRQCLQALEFRLRRFAVGVNLDQPLSAPLYFFQRLIAEDARLRHLCVQQAKISLVGLALPELSL